MQHYFQNFGIRWKRLYQRAFLFCLVVLLSSASLMAQKTVTGKTTTEDGEALVGVTIRVKGSAIGALSGADGSYSITVPSNDAVLSFSFIGYETVEQSVSSGANFNVSLPSGSFTTDEVVITALGIEKETKALTYSIQEVRTEELSEARALNAVNSLSGKVAGLSVTRSGSGVGGQSRVILRGNRSIAGSSQALYVVDGVPILGDPSDINPDDIASVSVLKGPNAAALYGNRANNGAIIITTKKGERGFRISVSSTLTAEVPNILQKYQNEFGQGNSNTYSPASEQSWGPAMNGGNVDHWSPNPEFGQSTYPFSPQPDNVSDFFQTGYSWANNVSISTGNERNQTYFSYTFTDAEGVVPNNTLQRHNAHVRITNKLIDGLTLDTKINYIREDIENSLSQGESFSNPIRHAYRLPRNIRTADVSIFEYTDAENRNRQHFWNPGSNGGANPYWTINRNTNQTTVDRVIAFASLKYDITQDLFVQVRTAVDRLNSNNQSRFANDSYIIADNGRFNVSFGESFEWNNDILLSYNKELTNDLGLSINAGANSRMERNTSLSGNTGDALTVPNFFTIGNSQDNRASHSFGAPRDVNSVYGFAQLSFRNAIFLDITGRNDWSSTLPSENNSFFYPSFGLNATLTDLMDFPSAITYIKVRGSYAIVGNDTRPFQTLRTAGVGAGGNNGFLSLSGTIPAEGLLPEETRSLEIGADLRFLEDRIGLDLSWYKSNSLNQLFAVALPVGSGASNLFTNGGDVQNSGIEAILRLNPIRTNDFDWDITFNFASNNSEVIAINDERPSLNISGDFLRSYRIEQGMPFGSTYSRGFERDAQGRVIIGANGLPLVTPGLNVLVADYNPDWLAGFGNTFTWKNLSASFLIDIRQGGSSTSLTNAILFADGLTEETLPGRDGTLVFGDNFFGDETAVLEDGSPNNIQISAEDFWRNFGGRNAPVGEAFAFDASNARLREFTLGYYLPLNGMLSGFKFSLVGRNLFFLWNEAGNIDPEVIVGTSKAAEGFESFGPPTSRSFGVNIRFDF